MTRYKVRNSSWFDTHKYDHKVISRAVKAGGGRNVRKAHPAGMSNIPKEVTFSANAQDLPAIRDSVQTAVGTEWIIIDIV